MVTAILNSLKNSAHLSRITTRSYSLLVPDIFDPPAVVHSGYINPNLTPSKIAIFTDASCNIMKKEGWSYKDIGIKVKPNPATGATSENTFLTKLTYACVARCAVTGDVVGWGTGTVNKLYTSRSPDGELLAIVAGANFGRLLYGNPSQVCIVSDASGSIITAKKTDRSMKRNLYGLCDQLRALESEYANEGVSLEYLHASKGPLKEAHKCADNLSRYELDFDPGRLEAFHVRVEKDRKYFPLPI